MNVNVYALGVGSNTDQNQLNDIASDPDADHVYRLASFDRMLSIVQDVSATACAAPAVITAGTQTATSVNGCETKYFQPECGTLAAMTVEVTTQSGEVRAYLSSTTTHPGPFDYEQAIETGESPLRFTVSREITADSLPISIAVKGSAPARVGSPSMPGATSSRASRPSGGRGARTPRWALCCTLRPLCREPTQASTGSGSPRAVPVYSPSTQCRAW